MSVQELLGGEGTAGKVKSMCNWITLYDKNDSELTRPGVMPEPGEDVFRWRVGLNGEEIIDVGKVLHINPDGQVWQDLYCMAWLPIPAPPNNSL